MAGWLHTEINVRHPDTVTRLSTNRARYKRYYTHNVTSVFLQLFGYNATADLTSTDAAVKPPSSSAAGAMAGETINVFAVSAKRRVGEAAGNRHRRDVVVQIRRIDELDCVLTATRRGIISTWSNKVFIIIIIISLNVLIYKGNILIYYLTGRNFFYIMSFLSIWTNNIITIITSFSQQVSFFVDF